MWLSGPSFLANRSRRGQRVREPDAQPGADEAGLAEMRFARRWTADELGQRLASVADKQDRRALRAP
jgi:hypothetical protein